MRECPCDVGGEGLEGGVIGLRANANDNVCRQVTRQQARTGKFSQTPLQPIPGDSRILVKWHDQTDSHAGPHQKCERGSDSPNLEVNGSNTLPLSHDSL